MKIVIHPKHQSAHIFISQLPEIFEAEGEMIYNGRNKVKRFQKGNDEWIIKRYKKPNLFQQIAYYFFRKSKAERAYLYADKLRTAGIDTPEGIAYIEDKKNGLLRFSYFISTFCPATAVYPVLVETTDYDRHLAASLAAFFTEMHSKGILHGDPNLNNILYRTDKVGRILFSVIDTNRSVFKTTLTPKECLDNLKRVTHRRDLLQYIIQEYATIRQWEVAKSVKIVMKALDKFERRREIKRIIKGRK